MTVKCDQLDLMKERKLLRREACKPGLNSKWRLLYGGPYVVERRVNDVNYLIRKLPNDQEVAYDGSR
jgi:hypothetical protein